MYASDCRRVARESLAGNWGLSVAVSFIAGLLGGAVQNTTSSVNSEFELDSETIQAFPIWAQEWLIKVLTILLIVNVIQFIIGSAVELGHCTFLLKQHDRKSISFGDLFCQMHRLGAGLCLRLWTLLYIFL